VSDDRLTPQERLALVALMTVARPVTNAELKAATGVELTGLPRRQLNDRKLVTSEKRGRPFLHTLTEAGWARGNEAMSAPRPEQARSAKLLFALLATFHRYIERDGVSLFDVFKPDVEQLIRDAYVRLADTPGAPVRLSALRTAVDSVLRKDLDGELQRMADQPDVYLRAEEDQQTLSDADREDALRLGGQDRHNLQIESL
jgi:hypothetical protein